MGYKRANWHSGLTYMQTCEECKQIVRYTDYSLGFRPWYPDGFVYCPKCKTPLRHNENYAINQPENIPAPKIVDLDHGTPISAFCGGCGKAFREGDNFCSGCGKKRD
jgi:predicted amidophosphoribosyltransferase